MFEIITSDTLHITYIHFILWYCKNDYGCFNFVWFYTHFFHVNPPVRFMNWICGSLCAENCGFYLMCHFEYVLWQWVWVWMCEWVIVCVCVGGVIGGWRGGKATSRSKVVHQPGCQVERVAQSFAALLFWRDAAGGWGGSWQRRVEEEEEGDQD